MVESQRFRVEGFMRGETALKSERRLFAHPQTMKILHPQILENPHPQTLIILIPKP